MAIALIRLTCCIAAMLSLPSHADTAPRKTYTPAQYLKNYALSACIADSYRSKEVIDDATAAANGYKELGSLDIDAYNEVAALAKTFIAKEYPSLSGEKLQLMKCVDFFHSQELDRIARKYARRK